MSLRPRNLTARSVVGNPVTTRPEAGVANCFPGLEFDVRNLDRRFFPGILFQFVVQPFYALPTAPPNQQGARILYLDYQEDPMLDPRSTEPWVQALLSAYNGDVGTALSSGLWYIDWIEQRGRRIYMHQDDMTPYDGLLVWRFVRSLEPDTPLSIGLVRRDGNPRGAVQLNGYRRKYLTPMGVIDPVFRPGELSESMCNPWTHDFRDCACHYWASNHPDVVLAAPELVQGRQTLYLDWLRADRGPAGAAGAAPTIAENRPYQLDHYQINHVWQELPFVLEGREIGATYRSPIHDHAKPYPDAIAMVHELRDHLARLELTLAFEYLYALFSIRAPGDPGFPSDRFPTLRDDVLFARHYLQIVAISEMTHLRWANQLLWELDRAGFYPPGEHYEPILIPSETVPIRKPNERALRPLTLDVLQSFIDVERPEGALDRAYAKCVATLEDKRYPRHLYELAIRIDSDGLNHYERCSDVMKTLRTYPEQEAPWLRPGVTIAKPDEARSALAARDAILATIHVGYIEDAKGNAPAAEREIRAARAAMAQLLEIAEAMARDRALGVPFFHAWPKP